MSSGNPRGRFRPPRLRGCDDRAETGLDRRSPDARLEAVRRWISDGGHNAPEVAEAVAKRILEVGDLDPQPTLSLNGNGRRYPRH